MADKKPIVNTNGELEVIQPTDRLVNPASSPYSINDKLTNAEATDMAKGEAVYLFSAAAIKRAKADNVTTAQAIGVTDEIIPAGQSGVIRTFGVVTGVGTMAVGVPIYLSAVTAGSLTTSVPTTSGQFIVRMGTGNSTTSLSVNIQPPILLS